MPYAKDRLFPQDQAEIRTEVRYCEVTEEQQGQRLDNYLHGQLEGVPRSRLYRVIRRGEVRVNGRRAGPETRLKAHDRIRIPPLRVSPPTEPGRPAAQLCEQTARSIVYEDDGLLVLDKPAGVAVHGGSGVSFGVIEVLRALRPEESLELVHRLDRDTSGCLLIARRPSVLRELHALMREGAVEKRYLALVRGKWPFGAKRIDVPLRTDTRVGGERTVRASAAGKPSVSEFRPVQFFGKTATLLEVILRTGRTHQIRVHAQHAGHPLAGDEKYGDAEFNNELKACGLKRMFLHAHSLSFRRPQDGDFSINTPLPPELAAVIDALAQRPSRQTQAARAGDSRRGAAPRRAR